MADINVTTGVTNVEVEPLVIARVVDLFLIVFLVSCGVYHQFRRAREREPCVDPAVPIVPSLLNPPENLILYALKGSPVSYDIWYEEKWLH